MECPTITELAGFLANREEVGDQNAFEVHVEACADCQRRLAELADVAKAVPGTPCPADLRNSSDSALLGGVMRTLAPHAPRQRIGDYELCDVIGQGGIGVVYRATDLALRRSVAIKMLRPGHADNAPMRERFLREARAAAALGHDYVVAIHGVSEYAGQPYLVMEFVEGGSLADRLREHGPLSPTQLIELGIAVASGLAAAHGKGIIHRDVKPGNVLWDAAGGRYKLTDFGLAKALDDVSLTRSGIVVGTPEFLSPEQADGRPVDARSDLFSLGAVLYAAAVGESPFHADSTLATISRVCTHTPPPLDKIRSDCPRDLARLVNRLLEKKPERRFSSAGEVVEELRRIAGSPTLPTDSTRPIRIGEPPGSSRRSLRRTVLAMGLLALAVAAAGIWYTTRDPVETDASPIVPTDPPKRGFRIVGQGTVFEQLSEAVAAAPADGVVEVYGNERLGISPVQVGKKPLTIRAAEGHRPILAPVEGRPMPAPAISTDASLTLSGLVLQWTITPPVDNPEMIFTAERCTVRTTGGALRMDHCEIEAGKDTDCLFTAAPLCEVRDSRFSARQGKCIGFNPNDGAKLTLENCVFSARSCLSIVWHEPGRQNLPASIVLARNTWQAERGIPMHVSIAPRLPLTFDVRQNEFNVEHVFALYWGHRGPRAAEVPSLANLRRLMTGHIKWQERENVYSASTNFVSWASARQPLMRLESGPSDVAQWEKFWNRPGSGSQHGAAPELRGKVGARPDRVGPEKSD